MTKIKDSLTYTDEFIEASSKIFLSLSESKKKELQFTRFDNFLAFRYDIYKKQYPGFKHILICE